MNSSEFRKKTIAILGSIPPRVSSPTGDVFVRYSPSDAVFFREGYEWNILMIGLISSEVAVCMDLDKPQEQSCCLFELEAYGLHAMYDFEEVALCLQCSVGDFLKTFTDKGYDRDSVETRMFKIECFDELAAKAKEVRKSRRARIEQLPPEARNAVPRFQRVQIDFTDDEQD